MTTLTIVPAIYEHIAPIAILMRDADRAEVEAMGTTPWEALETSLAKSAQTWTLLIDDEPAAMFGVGDLNILARKGSPWLLGTDAIDRNRASFAKRSVFWRDQLLARYDILTNIIHAENAASIRWLRWLGFSFSEPFKGGPRGAMFRVFEMRR